MHSHERPPAAVRDGMTPSVNSIHLLGRQLEQVFQEWPVPLPAFGNLLEIPYQIDVYWRLILLPHLAVIFRKTGINHLREIEALARFVFEPEKLLALPRRKGRSQTVSQRI